jgi:phosphoribosylamine--glycine ligase
MLTADGPRVLEFNVRLGDPEAQVILPRLDQDLTPFLVAAATGSLNEITAPPILRTGDLSTVGITLAAEGYPNSPRSGDSIRGVEDARSGGTLVFGAGIRRDDLGQLATSGGRVVTVVGRGSDVGTATDAAYAGAEQVSFAGRQMRTDIGRVLAEVMA